MTLYMHEESNSITFFTKLGKSRSFKSSIHVTELSFLLNTGEETRRKTDTEKLSSSKLYVP